MQTPRSIHREKKVSDQKKVYFLIQYICRGHGLSVEYLLM